MSGMGFLALENRYIVEGTLVAEAALHVGGGVSEKTEAACFRDAAGLVIPGSSLRGVMRSTLERILQALPGKKGCVLFEKNSHPTCLTVPTDKNREEIERLRKDEVALAAKLLEGDGLCDICKLFGSPLNASKLRIADCRPVEGSPVECSVRDSVAIDRDTDAAKTKLKYDFEVVESGARFQFRLQLENARDEDLALLAIALGELERGGIQVGGKKGRGLGRCRLEKGYTVSYFNRGTLAEYLASGEPRKMDYASFTKLLSDKLSGYLEQGG